jgi:GntR family transcriptional regulator
VAIVSVDPRDRTPIYAQLERAFRAAIATGRLAVGDQLPTVRQLAVELSINANTVAGTFVTATPAQAHPPKQQEKRLRAFVTRVLADASAAGFTLDDLLAGLQAHRKGDS